MPIRIQWMSEKGWSHELQPVEWDEFKAIRASNPYQKGAPKYFAMDDKGRVHIFPKATVG